MTQHTDGPWVIDPCGQETRIVAGHKHIASVWLDDDGEEVLPIEANAKLIAEAPTLLKVLRHLTSAANSAGQHLVYNALVGELSDAISIARALINNLED